MGAGAVTETELSVVLVNLNGADCLPRTLRALARNTVCRRVEGIVVDSGSTDGSWKGVAELWDHPRRVALRTEHRVLPAVIAAWRTRSVGSSPS